MPTTIEIPTIVLIYVILPAIVGLISFATRNVLSRISDLEERMQHVTSEPQVRQLINDRYDPLVQDIREIKEKLDKIFDLYMDSLKDKNQD